MHTEHAPRSRRRLPIALTVPAALALLLLGSGQAFAIDDATKYGTVTINDADTGGEVIVDGEPHVCTFTFDFDLGIEAPVLGWKVKVWNEVPLDGETVLKGQTGPTDADGRVHVPDSGALSAPNGRYNVVWDDEYPPDGSNGARSFVVDCKEPTPTPTDLGVGGTEPTPTETNLDLGVGGVTAITPPPTDTSTPVPAAAGNPIVPLAITLIALLTLVFTMSGQRLVDRSRRRSRLR